MTQPAGSYGTVPLNQWAHLAATWDGGTMRYYINGASVGSSTGTVPSPSAGMTIGASKSGGYPAKGTLDQVAVWAGALTAGEVQAHSQNTLLGDGLGDACDPCLNDGDAACLPTACIDQDGDGYGVQGASNCGAGIRSCSTATIAKQVCTPGRWTCPGMGWTMIATATRTNPCKG
jgi:hypothetical protein